MIIPIIKSCRVLTPKEIKFRSELEEMLPQNSVLDYRIDQYFPKHKLEIEVD